MGTAGWLKAQAGGSADGVAGAQDIGRLRLRLRWRIQRGFLAGGRGAGGWAAGAAVEPELWSRTGCGGMTRTKKKKKKSEISREG